MSAGILRIDDERLAVTFKRLVELSHFLKDDAQTIVCVQVPGVRATPAGSTRQPPAVFLIPSVQALGCRVRRQMRAPKARLADSR